MDAIVIGGGIIGMSVAWRLAQQGLQVAVYEAGTIGGEASWAGAGMLAPGGEFEQRSQWSDLAVESLHLYPAFVRELEAESGAKIDYRSCGAMEFAFTDQAWIALQERASRQMGMGVRTEVVKTGRMFYPDDALVDPRDVVAALRIACEQRGVELHEREQVTEIQVVDGKIQTPRPAGCAVLAAGAWSGMIPVTVDGQPQRLPPSVPVRGHLVAYRLPGVPGPILRSGHTYIVQRTNGITIAGSTTEQIGFARELNPLLVDEIEARAHQILPEISPERRVSAWLGFRPGMADDSPQIRRLPNAPVYLSYGHYRNGILLAPVTAKLISSWETGSLLPAGHH